MNKRFLAAFAALLTAVGACSCGSKDSSSSESSSEVQTTEAGTENTTEEITEEVTEETTKEPPVPAEASDPNTVTFDNGDCSFAKVINDDGYSAAGEVSVAELAGNKMLKFTDDFTVPMKGKVQKISISALPLVGKENIGKVRRIEFDLYADAVAQEYTDENGELKQVPGTICGGGGTATAVLDSEGKGKWYGFDDFEGGEYDFDYSGPLHQEFKFLLADTGQCWSEEMEDPNFLIMRWGSENKSNLYIDNIVFYDEEGNSIPILSSDNTANE
ncbi:MAG: hypothetical protein IKS13_04255 [Ruminococcus sp.]|nr:hypothetical protein [Ruminococcus sp.]